MNIQRAALGSGKAHEGRFFLEATVFVELPHSRERRTLWSVMPAQAGIQSAEPPLAPMCWIPAFAGMTNPGSNRQRGGGRNYPVNRLTMRSARWFNTSF
jgi:hypothetical protein